MKLPIVTLAAVAVTFAPTGFVSLAFAQTLNFSTIAKTNDGKLTFSGRTVFNVLTRRGKISGKRSDGIKCGGESTTNFLLTKGSGNFTCADGLKGSAKFTVQSRIPLRARGSGRLSDGRKFQITIRQ